MNAKQLLENKQILNNPKYMVISYGEVITSVDENASGVVIYTELGIGGQNVSDYDSEDSDIFEIYQIKKVSLEEALS